MKEVNKNKAYITKSEKTLAQKVAVKELIDLLANGECKGIKNATAYRIEAFARERGFL